MGRSDRDGAGIFNPPCAELVLFRGVEYCMRQSTTSVKTITLEAAKISYGRLDGGGYLGDRVDAVVGGCLVGPVLKLAGTSSRPLLPARTGFFYGPQRPDSRT